MRARWAIAAAILVGVLALGWVQPCTSQVAFNEREVKVPQTPGSDIWVFDFRFKDPRLIKVNVPGRGTRICWYLWYQVINRTGEPRRFVPDFELVTLDFPGAYPDEVLPSVEQAIRKSEDPTGYQDIKNSVTIGKALVPLSLPDAFPKAVTGVAIWDGSAADPKKRDANLKELSDCTRFSIFVRGLSNGFVVAEPIADGQPPVTRYKTLQLNFKRQGDRFSTDSRDISFVAPAEWIYRSAGRKIP